MSQLIIYLPEGVCSQAAAATDRAAAQSAVAQAELPFCLLSASGQIAAQGTSRIALLPKADGCAVVLPAQAMSWHAVQLPKLPRGTSPAKLQTILAGVLEDQLLDEPAALHLSHFTAASGQHFVAAGDKALLQSALAAFAQAGWQVNHILPSAWPLALQSADASAGAENDTLARLHAHGTAHSSAYSSPQSSSESAWITLSDKTSVVTWPLAQAGLLNLPEPMQISAEPAVAALAEKVLQQRVPVQTLHQQLAQTTQLALAAKLNLAQGEFAPRAQGFGLHSLMDGLRNFLLAPQWQAARWGAAALLLAQLVGLNAWAWRESSQLQAKRDEMKTLLSGSFPQVKVVVDAPLQMQRELAALRQSQGQLSGQDFESIYGRFSGVAGIKSAPSAIEFIANEVNLKGLEISDAQMQEIAPKLQFAGIAARSQGSQLILSQRSQEAR